MWFFESYIVNIILVCMPVIFISVFLAAKKRSNNLLYIIRDQCNTIRHDISDGDLLSKLYMYIKRYFESRNVIIYGEQRKRI